MELIRETGNLNIVHVGQLYSSGTCFYRLQGVWDLERSVR